jgi:uncharacterized protein with ParB-like and HNH nuclease domain
MSAITLITEPFSSSFRASPLRLMNISAIQVGEKTVDERLSDLLDQFQNSFHDGDHPGAVSNYEEYFLGSSIVSKRNGKNYLIDGQQRVTSLTLLLIYWVFRESSG